jgi:hypothetical protein
MRPLLHQFQVDPGDLLDDVLQPSVLLDSFEGHRDLRQGNVPLSLPTFLVDDDVIAWTV